MPVPTSAQRHKLNRDPIADPHVMLLEFQEEGRSEITRLAINTESVTHNGNVYTRAPIDAQLPGSASDDTSAELSVSNIDRVIGRIIDKARQRIGVRVMFVDTSVPDVAIVDTKNLLAIESVTGNSVRLTARLAPKVSLIEPVPFQKTTRNFFPGVWFA